MSSELGGACLTDVQRFAVDHEECCICFLPLIAKPVACLHTAMNRRVCVHYYHKLCADTLSRRESRRECCFCRQPFRKVSDPCPSPLERPKEFFKFIDVDNNGEIDKLELVCALKATLPLDWRAIDRDVDSLFSRWDHNGDGKISYSEFISPGNGVLSYLQQRYSRNPEELAQQPIPDIRTDRHRWFLYWDTDYSNSLSKVEIIHAVLRTFELSDSEASEVAECLDRIWCLFDSDGSGSIELSEFEAPDNLADTIIATMNQYRP